MLLPGLQDAAGTNQPSYTPIFGRRKQRLKINPLATWTSKDVWTYVTGHDVIYNPLHDQGYPSIGDEPTTTPVNKGGEDQRAGRWRGTVRTECGIHCMEFILNVVSRQLYKSVIKIQSNQKNKDEQLKFVTCWLTGLSGREVNTSSRNC